MRLLDGRVTLYIIIVLYKIEAKSSGTFCSLLRSLAEASERNFCYRVLLYDNTPSAKAPSHLPEHVEYIAARTNTGLADAYNVAVAKAHDADFDWLLTLDQDTELPLDFIPQLVGEAHHCKKITEIAAIVPHVSSGTRDVSPYWFAAGIFPRWFPKGYHGTPKKTVYAFNSGTLVRISAVEQIGGYNPLFWLDYCDAYLFQQLKKNRLKVFVAGRIHVQHDFSMLDISNKMGLFRYKNAVEAGSTFFDLEMGAIAGIEHTAHLAARYLKQVLLRENRQVRKVTCSMLLRRLFVSKSERIRTWTEEQQERILAQRRVSPQKAAQ